MKFDVTLADGRTMQVFAPDEASAQTHARHHEWTRYDIAVKRGQVAERPSEPVSAVKLKD